MRFSKPRIVLSKCIEHEHCRYDGSKISSTFINKLKNHVKFITVCPEVEIGLPIPRQALRIITLDDESEKMVFSKTGEDVTQKMLDFSHTFLEGLGEVDAFILKSSSPSCGLKGVKLYKNFGKSPALPKKTKGIFAREVLNKFSNIPIEEDGRLRNFNIREHFLTRIFTEAAFKTVKMQKSMPVLIDFHSKNKYLFMAHSPGNLKKMGKIVANNDNKDMEDMLNEYQFYLSKALSIMSKPMRNVNMLLHLFGYFSKHLSSKEKAFFLENLERYSERKIPFSVPLAIINSYVMRFENEYLLNQTIFNPFPEDLIEVTDSGKGV